MRNPSFVNHGQNRVIPGVARAESNETEIQAVKRVLAALIAAVRNFSLYPCEHSICQKCLRSLKTGLSEFFTHETSLRIEINKNWVSYREIKLYEPSEKNDPLLSPLFRDGILWVEIFPGIELSELEVFLKLFGKHRSLKDEAESDLVTALWKANLTHIRYEAINSLWENPPVLEFSHFRLGNETQTPIDEIPEKGESPKDAGGHPFLNINNIGDRDKFFELTPTENQLLRKLISSNDAKDDTNDVINILTVILEDQCTEKDFSCILDLLEQELNFAQENARFNHVHALFEKIKQLVCDASGSFSWRNKLIHDFFLKVSSGEALKSLETGLLKLKAADSNQISQAKSALLMLEPKAVETLAGLLLKTHSRTLQLLLMNIIKKLSLRDLVPLERLLSHANVRLVKKLITILGHIKGKRPRELLQRLMGHSSEEVRHKALLWLIKRGELPIDKIDGFLNDRDPRVRSQIFDHMRREKNPHYECILRDFIDKKKFRRDEQAFLITCYQVLGNCASKESLPFLEKKLFKRTGFSLFGPITSLHRQGAAAALAQVGSQDAKLILSRASRSFYPSVRRAYRKALESATGAE